MYHPRQIKHLFEAWRTSLLIEKIQQKEELCTSMNLSYRKYSILFNCPTSDCLLFPYLIDSSIALDLEEYTSIHEWNRISFHLAFGIDRCVLLTIAVGPELDYELYNHSHFLF